jgi:hypothetical protein
MLGGVSGVRVGGAWGALVQHKEADLLSRIATLEAELAEAARTVGVVEGGEREQRTLLQTVHAAMVTARGESAGLRRRLAAEQAARRAAAARAEREAAAAAAARAEAAALGASRGEALRVGAALRAALVTREAALEEGVAEQERLRNLLYGADAAHERRAAEVAEATARCGVLAVAKVKLRVLTT